MKTILFLTVFLFLASSTFAQQESSTENYSFIVENGFKSTTLDPLSTLSIDGDGASYSNIRRFLNRNQLPMRDAVRIEEMVNYFDYNFFNATPEADAPFTVNTELVTCPWNQKASLLLGVGLKGEKLNVKKAPQSHVVFLVDVSASMKSENKMSLVKPTLKMLVDQMRDVDKLSIIAFDKKAKLSLPTISVLNKDTIYQVIDSFKGEGIASLGDALHLAYQVARENYLPAGDNRIILATDGDFEIGYAGELALMELVDQFRQEGISLNALGFGMGNYNDSKLDVM